MTTHKKRGDQIQSSISTELFLRQRVFGAHLYNAMNWKPTIHGNVQCKWRCSIISHPSAYSLCAMCVCARVLHITQTEKKWGTRELFAFCIVCACAYLWNTFIVVVRSVTLLWFFLPYFPLVAFFSCFFYAIFTIHITKGHLYLSYTPFFCEHCFKMLLLISL